MYWHRKVLVYEALLQTENVSYPPVRISIGSSYPPVRVSTRKSLNIINGYTFYETGALKKENPRACYWVWEQEPGSRHPSQIIIQYTYFIGVP